MRCTMPIFSQCCRHKKAVSRCRPCTGLTVQLVPNRLVGSCYLSRVKHMVEPVVKGDWRHEAFYGNNRRSGALYGHGSSTGHHDEDASTTTD